MADPMAKRFERKTKEQKLEDNDRRVLTADELKAEQELLKNTKKVDPIKAEKVPDRNDPCPCGSGKKYKKCCGAAK